MSGSSRIHSTPKSQRETDSFDNCGVSINDLPQDVIIRIMSLLTMEEAVRTSVLSKDWEYKWASIFSIKICDRPMEKASFIDFVNRILLHSQNIQSLSLSCRYLRDPTSLKTWISSLSMRSIQRIEIVSSDCGGFTLPHCLFDNTSPTSLKLRLPCVMKIPAKDYLCNLKFLSLSMIHFQNEHLSNTDELKFMFPVLKSLELSLCTWGDVKFVEISSPSLTSFNMFSEAVANDFLIKICGAKLEEFLITGGMLLDNFDLNASLVVRASIFFASRRCDHPLVGVSRARSRISIEGFLSLKYLRLIGWRFKGSKAYAQLMPGLPLPRFNRLQTLELLMWGSIEAFVELLHMAPTLQKLIIQEYSSKYHDPEDFNLDAVGLVPPCMSSHLAEIKFPKFLGTTREFHLVEFLLKNSVKLEKVIVSVLRELLIPEANIKELLLTYPKSSTCILAFT